jgi:prophage antirepressor-like protein
MLNQPFQVLKQTELLGHQFTVYGTAENPLFLAKEVAECINHSNITVMLQSIDEDERIKFIPKQSLGVLVKNKEYNLLTEGGLYEVLMQSRKPIAKEFKKGVKEILKSIRKTGGYIATKQDDTPEEIMARALIVAQETIKRKEERLKQLEEKNAKLQPKADFAEAAFKAEGKVDIGQAAKILNLGFGRNTLFGKLREAGVFFANRNEPKQKYIDAGYFEVTEKPIPRKNHPGFIVMVVICTQKGLAFINHLFGGKPSDGKIAKIK